jgi:hypothetical protein
MNPELGVFLVLLLLSVMVAIILFFSLHNSLRDLLQSTIKLPAGVTFYLRSFALVLVLAALSAAIGIVSDMKSGAHFMEYVWTAAGGLSSVLEAVLGFLAVYLVLITILVATLKPKREE